MVYITGDCHADFSRFSEDYFPEQRDLTRDDIIIVMGDFGIWHDTESERVHLDWLAKKNFTIVFVDGNHENYDRIYSDEFEVVNFHGGKAQKIRENIFHLMRGYVFEFCGKKFFAFGGAKSHDIRDGIMHPEDYRSTAEMEAEYIRRWRNGEMFRVEHLSWWEQELPTDKEIAFARDNLKRNGNKVDYIISHCAPKSVSAVLGFYDSDNLTEFFEEVKDSTEFTKWICGHYHVTRNVLQKYFVIYEEIERLL